MAPAETTTQEITCLHAALGEAFGRAAQDAIRKLPPARRPSLIGLAGQTVCHLPGRRPGGTVTLQLGEPARVAARTGLAVVAGFRQSDVAAGGQGAPLVPWTDWVLFRHQAINRIVQNIGGIGNLTWLPAGARPQDVVAFDTGPGNMVIDALVAVATGGGEQMDRDGRRAARGRVLPDVLRAWLGHPFLARKPPKSTGREVFGAPFIEAELPRLMRASPRPDDWIATATAFTAQAIARACRALLKAGDGGRRAGRFRRPLAARAGAKDASAAGKLEQASELIVCGGGAKNPVLTGLLATLLPGVGLRRIDSLGIPAQAKEAVSFAMLAAACVDAVPANLPQVTGAKRSVVLGHVTPAPVRRVPASRALL
jgi:anhydro-N-acetylmuramic acid kinase